METLNQPPGIAPRRILIIDDDSVDRYILSRNILAAMPPREITEANSGETALSILTKLVEDLKPMPDLIFLDLNMSPMTGIEFLEKFEEMSLKHQNNCQVMIITAKPDDGEKQKVMSHKHVAGYYVKPLT